MTKEDKIRSFLGTLPDDLILSEAGRRNASRRQTAGRSKVMRGCKFCGQFFGMRDLRKHLSSAHPGGKTGGHKPLQKPPVGHKCLHCDEVHGARALRLHVRKAHPEKCRPETRKVTIK